jgi:Zn-dependent protease/CBS domain-containing protein
MGWSFHVVRVFGTELRVHVTFLVLLAWVGLARGQEAGWLGALEAVVFVCLIFGCVVLHEFGHALAARRFGIATPQITLLPIGGVAQLERIPEKPIQEICVAVAGPAVNVGIAGLLTGWIVLTGGFPSMDAVASSPAVDLPVRLLGVNVWLVLFNLIPAFPMDGGRVLRALLALRTPYTRATHIAAGIGQFIAVVFGVLGLLSNPMLILIALFIYFGAASEATLAQVRAVSSGLRVDAVMVTGAQSLGMESTLDDAVELLLRTSQKEFPVVNESGRLEGMLTGADLILALRRSPAQTPASEVMRVGVPCVPQSTRFESAFRLLQESNSPALGVVDAQERFIGLFTPENIGELLMVEDALASGSHPSHFPHPAPGLGKGTG